MNSKFLPRTRAGALAGFFAVSVALAQTTPTGFVGQAGAVGVSGATSEPFPNPISIANTGPLPGGGGSLAVSSGAVSQPGGAFAIQGASASVVGAGNQVASTSAAQGLHLEFIDANGGHDVLEADSLRASVTARCAAGLIVEGSTQISGLTVNGQPVAATSATNQSLAFNGFTLRLNVRVNHSAAELIVVAVQLDVPNLLSGTFGYADAGTTCVAAPPCPPPSVQLGLGEAGRFTVFGLRGAHLVVDDDARIAGDLAVGPDATGDAFKAQIDGTLHLDPAAQPDRHAQPTRLIAREDLSGAADTALAASANLATLAPTETRGDVIASTTFTGNGGLNVIALNSVDLAHGTLTLRGTSSDVFVVNVRGPFRFTASRIQFSGDVSANHLLWNFPATGRGDVELAGDATLASGLFLAPARNLLLDDAALTGALFGGALVRVRANAIVQNPCPP